MDHKVKNNFLDSRIQRVTETNGKHHFFGYYDISPWDASETYILSHGTDFIDRMPRVGQDVAQIGVWDTRVGSFHRCGETKAWNWQQGARLQWLPPYQKDKIVFNDYRNKTLTAIVLDSATGEESVIGFPVYSIAPNGTEALTVNFARLARLGGYGYEGILDVSANEKIPADDGIYSIDLKTGKRKLLISVATAASRSFVQTKSHHYLAHMLYNPLGTQFCFFHRTTLADGGRHTRLLLAERDGSNIRCLAEGNLSHFDWYDDKHILIWGRRRQVLTKMRAIGLPKKIFFQSMLRMIRNMHGTFRHRILGDQCFLIHIDTCRIKPFGVGMITEDGHFSTFKKTGKVLGDTYPNKDCISSLYIYDPMTDIKETIGFFHMFPDYKYNPQNDWSVSALRCDLHPRLSKSETRVCIDSVHEGSRQMYVINI